MDPKTDTSSVEDPDPRFGMGKKIKIRIRDEHPGSHFRELRNNFWVKNTPKFFDADPGSGIFLTWIRDPGWEKFGSGTPDPQH
jgi:hypothetical protein